MMICSLVYAKYSQSLRHIPQTALVILSLNYEGGFRQLRSIESALKIETDIKPIIL